MTMTEFVDPTRTAVDPTETHVHRNYQQRPIIIPVGDEKRGTHTCKICGNKIEGVTYQRVTRFIGALEDRYGLERWQERNVALGLANRPDLMLSVSNNASDDGKLDEICEKAKEAAGSNVKRELGTELHTLIERIERGDDPPIPPSFKADLDAYRAATGELVVRETELFVVNDELRVAGTLDQLIEYLGQLVIGDLKTGSIDLSALKVAMQLAIYARSKRYDPATGERSPLGANPWRAVTIHLPPGTATCSLRWADLDVGWRGVELARQVWDFRGERGVLDASEPEPVPALDELIKVAGDRQSIVELWATWGHVWTDDFTELARQQLASIEESRAVAREGASV